MNTSKTLKARIMVVIAVMALWASSLACDNGGTINPDAGCIGQGSNMTSCNELINSLP